VLGAKQLTPTVNSDEAEKYLAFLRFLALYGLKNSVSLALGLDSTRKWGPSSPLGEIRRGIPKRGRTDLGARNRK
jgi:hypothetical protein